MNAVEYFLPPNVYRKNKAEVEAAEVRGYLEIEVSHINFITEKLNCTKSTSSLYKNQHKTNQLKLPSSLRKKILSRGVIVKFVWWGEQEHSSAKVKSTLSSLTLNKTESTYQRQQQHKLYKQRSGSHHFQNKYNNRLQQQQQQQHWQQEYQKQQQHQCGTIIKEKNLGKLRYGVRSSFALFLEYLRECPSIEIVASVNDNDQEPLGQAYLPLPALLLQKYADNYVNACNFEYKTKIYALYHHVKSSATACQVQQQQQLKTGEIQLRFKMLFTAAALPPTHCSEPVHALKLPTEILQKQLHPSKMTVAVGKGACRQQQINGKLRQQSSNHAKQRQGHPCTGKSNVAVRPAGKSAEIMDAMKKLDANLAALLADATIADTVDRASHKSVEQLKRMDHKNSPLSDLDIDAGSTQVVQRLSCIDAELFMHVSALKLNLEALTLQAEGTKRMELLQNEIRPIFTVECQLSNDLIKSVPRYDMFNVMQFESEKFQSLTQCTRFGQEAQREVRLPINKNSDSAISEMGRLHFIVWSREPGTCLNEMLGMGSLDLVELYKASLLEQCKCIQINRRGTNLANIYLKVSLLANVSVVNDYITIANGDAGEQNKQEQSSSTGQQSATEAATAAAGIAGQNNNNNPNANNDNNVHENTAASAPDKSNNNPELAKAKFKAETTKVRLLKGFIYINDTRHLLKSATEADLVCSLICQPFWQQERIHVVAGAQNAFNFQQQFSIINDEQFLKCVELQHMLLEIEPLTGVVRLPLHQFFIAYRDATISNHLCKAKLPVISIDAWAPILHRETGATVGEVKCLLAIGSDAQITYLRETRGFSNIQPLNNPLLRSTSDLMDILQSALKTPIGCASLEPYIANNSQTFKFSLNIVAAAGLPLNPGGIGKGKKVGKRQAASKRFIPNEPPSTYVTFQVAECNSIAHKSHEGIVYATHIVEKSIAPQWKCKFRVTASIEYLTNPRKLFILKVWKKAAVESIQTGSGNQQPTPLEDAIIGFAALNLNLIDEDIQPGGWYNIVDFNGRINGGLEVYVQPLEDLHKFLQRPIRATVSALIPSASAATPSATANANSTNMDAVIDNFEQTLELTHLNLGQAIKRKFNELEQISQRLRTRLANVTGQQFVSQFDEDALDNWQPLSVNIVEEIDEFERDLRTPPPVSPTAHTATQNAYETTSTDVTTEKAQLADDNSPKE